MDFVNHLLLKKIKTAPLFYLYDTFVYAGILKSTPFYLATPPENTASQHFSYSKAQRTINMCYSTSGKMSR